MAQTRGCFIEAPARLGADLGAASLLPACCGLAAAGWLACAQPAMRAGAACKFAYANRPARRRSSGTPGAGHRRRRRDWLDNGGSLPPRATSAPAKAATWRETIRASLRQQADAFAGRARAGMNYGEPVRLVWRLVSLWATARRRRLRLYFCLAAKHPSARSGAQNAAPPPTSRLSLVGVWRRLARPDCTMAKRMPAPPVIGRARRRPDGPLCPRVAGAQRSPRLAAVPAAGPSFRASRLEPSGRASR